MAGVVGRNQPEQGTDGGERNLGGESGADARISKWNQHGDRTKREVEGLAITRARRNRTDRTVVRRKCKYVHDRRGGIPGTKRKPRHHLSGTDAYDKRSGRCAAIQAHRNAVRTDARERPKSRRSRDRSIRKSRGDERNMGHNRVLAGKTSRPAHRCQNQSRAVDGQALKCSNDRPIPDSPERPVAHDVRTSTNSRTRTVRPPLARILHEKAPSGPMIG